VGYNQKLLLLAKDLELFFLLLRFVISRPTYGSVVQVNLVANHDKWEIFWIAGTGLYKELISPAVQCLECVWHGHVEHQYAAIGTSVEGDS